MSSTDSPTIFLQKAASALPVDAPVGPEGITQDRVDRGLPLVEVLRQHSEWLRMHGLLGAGKQSWAPITWSEWDLKVQLETECKWRHISKPSYLQRWIDLRPHYAKFVNRPCGLRGSVEQAGLEWQGRLHSGIDDAINTARLAAFMMRDRGALLTITGSFNGLDKSGQLRQTTLFPNRPQRKHRIVNDSGAWNGRCECGVKAQVRTVSRPGVNHGRRFYGKPVLERKAMTTELAGLLLAEDDQVERSLAEVWALILE
ncbi:hypothetical protein WJX84_005213 [Apatococcus fuscideae]|uniref:Exonuclease domain-containing protein n=1 Tax=Apatococcus fuscideae TaxID=2026836 RepID=A0AAW1SR33_9CHLO